MGVIECQLSVKFLTSQNFISRISAISPKKEKKKPAPLLSQSQHRRISSLFFGRVKQMLENRELTVKILTNFKI